MRSIANRGAVAAAALVAGLACSGAHAAAIGISNLGGLLTFSACDFEGGMTVNGSALTGGACTLGPSTGGTVTPGGSSLSFAGTWITPGTQANTGPVTVYFTSAGDPTQYASVLSYEITDAGGTSTISGSFSTGFGDLLGAVPTGAATVVSGSPFSFDYAFMGAVVQTSPVSAPGTLALLGLGLAGAALLRRRSV